MDNDLEGQAFCRLRPGHKEINLDVVSSQLETALDLLCILEALWLSICICHKGQKMNHHTPKLIKKIL